jgi:hypothetical protein
VAADSRRLSRSWKQTRPSLGLIPQDQGPSHEFAPLQHIKVHRSGSRGSCLPATFRPQGFITLSTAYALWTPARLVACERRSWGSPCGGFLSRKVTGPLGPVEPTRRLHARRSGGKPPAAERAQPLGFDPRGSPLPAIRRLAR